MCSCSAPKTIAVIVKRILIRRIIILCCVNFEVIEPLTVLIVYFGTESKMLSVYPYQA